MKVVLQDGIKDCGICSLLSIIRFYGGEVPKEYLREITHTTKEGVSLYNLLEGAKYLGFDAIGLTGTLENIDVNNLPCIVHFIVNKNYKHFVVLYEINKKKKTVTLMDPAKGKKNISFQEFNLLSSNSYLFLKPIKKLPIMLKKNIIYKKILETLKSNKKLLLMIILLTSSYFIINLITSFHFKYIIEYAINYNISNNILIITYLIFFLYLLKNCNSFIRNILLNKWTAIFDLETTSITYKQLLLLPYLYYKNRTCGEVISRFKDLNTVRIYITNFFCIISTDLITIIIFFIVLEKYNKILTLILLIPLLILFLFTIFVNKNKKKIIPKLSISNDKVNSYIIEGISNVDTIKGFHLEKRMIDKFKITYKNLLKLFYKYNNLLEIYNFIKNNINDIFLVLIYGIGSYQVVTSKTTLSNLIIYQTFFNYFINCFYQIISVIEEYNSYKIALDRVEEIFMIHKDNFNNNYFYSSYKLDGNITINNLNYKVGSKYLFKDLNLKIKKGEKILLSGESGSGKSTLLKMLLRYIEVDFNHIKISDIDINHYHLENIRSNITYVTNSEYLFNDTIKNNILLYKECEEEKFKKICNICSVNDIIKNNITGYDTMIEENGFNFSNGERQRIILARSILRNSNIYIFDEAFSGIDILKEKKILTSIFDYLKDKTIIVISHRFNNKKCFDRILKLEDGTIYENK
ncbi:MAG: ATP-binding cassette domain-containing protein [Bacilli bacterium]|nr:ATP-binding cassette domain-containing protein [Bacilli bacterium]